jgi:hypothetical protein
MAGELRADQLIALTVGMPLDKKRLERVMNARFPDTEEKPGTADQ